MTGLNVKREVTYVDGAGTLEDGLRHPDERAVVGEHGQRLTLLLQAGVGAGTKDMLYLTTHSTHFIYGYMASNIW